MKKNITIAIMLVVAAINFTFAQNRINIGAGYFGHTITHKGLVLEAEYEKLYSEKATLPIRLDLGFYNHLRNHTGIFLDFNAGYRRYFKSGLVLEESIGFGVLQTILNDPTFSVDDQNNVKKVSGLNQIDVIPSLTLGVGYNLSRKKETLNMIWFRPKLFWQYPQKKSMVFGAALQVGFTHSL